MRYVDGTFTIGGTDNATNQVGGAGSTCVEEVEFSAYDNFYTSVPGKSVLLSQGYYRDRNDVLTTANQLMANDTLPEIVLESITTPAVDPFEVVLDENTTFAAYDLRQYGLVDLSGNSAGYTGSELEKIYNIFGYEPSSQTDEQGMFDSFSFSAQGNIVSEHTVPTLASSFQAEEGACDLAQRLMNAITSVHAAGDGDRRCANGVGSVAFVHVDGADGQEVIHIDVPFEDEEGFDAFAILKESFLEWRALNPCTEDDSTGINTTQTIMLGEGATEETTMPGEDSSEETTMPDNDAPEEDAFEESPSSTAHHQSPYQGFAFVAAISIILIASGFFW